MGHTIDTIIGGVMDKKPQQKSSKDSWNDKNDKLTNPNRRQEEDQAANVDQSQSGQRAKTGPGSRETPSSDRQNESQGDGQKTDTSRRQRQTEE